MNCGNDPCKLLKMDYLFLSLYDSSNLISFGLILISVLLLIILNRLYENILDYEDNHSDYPSLLDEQIELERVFNAYNQNYYGYGSFSSSHRREDENINMMLFAMSEV